MYRKSLATVLNDNASIQMHCECLETNQSSRKYDPVCIIEFVIEPKHENLFYLKNLRKKAITRMRIRTAVHSFIQPFFV